MSFEPLRSQCTGGNHSNSETKVLGPLKGTNKIVEGQRAHFEARVEPENDMALKVSEILSHRILMNSVVMDFSSAGLYFV